MPNRMLRDWTQSDKIDQVSSDAERFFTRLIMKVDDYGCFYADIRLLKANLFPLKLDKIREADITRWIAECVKAGLILFYEVDQKKYLQILDFRQRLDRARSKYPLPESVNDPREIVNECPPELEVEQKQKENQNALDSETHAPEVVKNFEAFQLWIKNNSPNVAKLKEPFTLEQFVKLKEDFTTNQIQEMLLKMHNYQKLLKNNVSANLTFRNWSKKDFNGVEQPKQTNGLSSIVKQIESELQPK